MLVESDPAGPTTAYGRSKLRAEQEVAAAGDRYVIFRPTLTYGSGVVGNMGRLIRLSTGRIPPPFGALHNKRSLLAVETMCEAVSFALKTEAAMGQTFLLADPEPVSVAEMVLALREGGGMRGGGLRMPPAILSALARLIGAPIYGIKLRVTSSSRSRSSGRSASDGRSIRARDCALSAQYSRGDCRLEKLARSFL